MKKIISVLLCALLAGSCVFAGCGNNDGKSSDSGSSSSSEEKKNNAPDPTEGIKAVASTDNYRNVYQIFVNSFCDSNNDGIGDINGIISQLDYINDGDPTKGKDLGADAIWLTPVMPSKSYHKYDVEDYYDIDKNFGTLKDYEKLLSECHKRGIKVIMDLVLNHISSQNPLFVNAVKEVSDGKLDGDAQYFEVHKSDYFSSDVQVVRMGNDYVCEANFSLDMPEWNLNSDKTRAEFKKIAKFWLDKGVDGFRLDAVKYYTNKETDGVKFLKWFCDTCRDIKKEVYLVGEDWSGDSEIEDFYKSDIDSLFAFKFATSTGQIVEAINNQNGTTLVKKLKAYDEKMGKASKNFINAMFLSNHDQLRIANSLEGKGLDCEKFAANIYMLAPGNSYTYYGEEIGMTSPQTEGDAYYRLPMVFDSKNLQKITVPGTGDDFEAPEAGGVKQQLEDENSLLNHYRRIINVKLQNPEIARGKITKSQKFDDQEIGAYYVEYKGSKLLIIHNFSAEESKELTITDDMIKNATVRADLLGDTKDGHVELKDGKLTLPKRSSVIIKSAEK